MEENEENYGNREHKDRFFKKGLFYEEGAAEFIQCCKWDQL